MAISFICYHIESIGFGCATVAAAKACLISLADEAGIVNYKVQPFVAMDFSKQWSEIWQGIWWCSAVQI